MNKPFTNLSAIVLILAIAYSVVSFGQKPPRDTINTKKVLPAQVQLFDTTYLFSIKDLNELNATFLQEMPAKYANPILQWMQTIIDARVQEWEKKNGKGGKP